MFRSGVVYDYGVGYFGPLARDGVWHEALIAQLSKAIPPGNPGFAGEALTNYHYYYDLLVSLIARVGIPVNFLLYRFFPVLFSILLGIGTYKLTQALFKNKFASLLSVFFAYFGSSFGWIVSLVKGEEIGGESAFWANQPVSMNLNPPFAISLVIIIFVVLLINSFIKRPKFLNGLVIVLLSGLLIGFKVYAGVILVGGMFLLTVKLAIFHKDYKLLPVFIASLAISLAVFLPQSKDSVGLIKFQPFWLIDTMIDAGDRVGIPNFTARRFAYLAEDKWIHLIGLETICFLIFLVGNLGTRIVGILGLRKGKLKNDLFVLVFALMGLSFIPPLLFVQKGNPWNIIQFFYYFLYFAGIFAAWGLTKVPIPLMALIIILTPISSVATFRSWLYPNPPAYLNTDEYEALKFLGKKEDGTVLKHPFDKNLRSQFSDPFPLSVYADNAYVSAYSGKEVFIEDVEQQLILDVDYGSRLAQADRFFVEKNVSWSNGFLKENDIKYVYLPKIYQLPTAEEEYSMIKIFENNGANIYLIK